VDGSYSVVNAREWAGGSLSRIVGMPAHWLIPFHRKRKEREKSRGGRNDVHVTYSVDKP
jgi:hypothetical protein